MAWWRAALLQRPTSATTQHKHATNAKDSQPIITAPGQTDAFNINKFRGLENHAETCESRACALCKFWKHRSAWTDVASFKNASGRSTPWLACSRQGGAVCVPCHDSCKSSDAFATGNAKFNLYSIKRHATTQCHAKALDASSELERAFGCEQFHVHDQERTSPSHSAQESSPYVAAIKAARALVEKRGAFDEHGSLVKAAGLANG